MSVLDYIFAISGHLLALAVVGVSLYRGVWRRFASLNLYAVALLVCDLSRYSVLHAYGFTSKPYFFAYYVSDALLTVVLYLVILSFFDIIFRESPLREPVRLALRGAFALLCVISYLFISNTASHFYSRLAVEFQQNMYFASVVLAVLLCGSLAYLRIRDPQMGMLISGLGVYAAAQASAYAVQNLLPQDLYTSFGEVSRRMPAVATAVMLALWCYALVKLPVMSNKPVAHKDPEPALVPAWISSGEGR